MKATAAREDIVSALDRVRRVSTGKESSKARIAAADGVLSLMGNDSTVFLACRVPATVTREGEIGISPADLAEMIRRMPDGARVTIDVNEKEHRISVSAEGSKRSFKLACVDSADIPPHRGVSPTPDGAVGMPGDALASALKRVVGAAYQNGDRANMQGIAFDGRNMAMRLIATDGRRLASTDLDGAAGDGETPRLLHTSAARLVAAEAASMGNVFLVVDDRGFSFASEFFDVWSPHVDAKCPPYEAIDAQIASHTTAPIDVRAAIGAFNAMATVGDCTKLSLRNGVHLAAFGEHELAEDEISGDVTGKGGTVYVSTAMMLDTLKSCPDSTATIAIGEPLNPIVIDSGNGRYRAIVLPMNAPAGAK